MTVPSLLLSALLLGTGCAWLAAGLPLPSFFERCPTADPKKLNECGLCQANKAVPHLAKDDVEAWYDGDMEFNGKNDGEEHVELTRHGFNFTTTRARYNFSNLFGDENLTSFLERCPTADPEKLNECALRQANTGLPLVVKGLRKYGLVPLNPLYVLAAALNYHGIRIDLSHLYFHGLPESTVKSVNVDLKRGHLQIIYFIPQLVVNFTYVLDGRILMLPLKGKGNGSMVFDDVEAQFDADVEFREKDDGEEHLEVTFATNDYTTTKVRYNFTIAFNGDHILGRATNAFLNENWSEVNRELRAPIGKIIAPIFVNMIQHISDLVPVKEMFDFGTQ